MNQNKNVHLLSLLSQSKFLLLLVLAILKAAKHLYVLGITMNFNKMLYFLASIYLKIC